jgi:hypothetical protein
MSVKIEIIFENNYLKSMFLILFFSKRINNIINFSTKNIHFSKNINALNDVNNPNNDFYKKNCKNVLLLK